MRLAHSSFKSYASSLLLPHSTFLSYKISLPFVQKANFARFKKQDLYDLKNENFKMAQSVARAFQNISIDKMGVQLLKTPDIVLHKNSSFKDGLLSFQKTKMGIIFVKGNEEDQIALLTHSDFAKKILLKSLDLNAFFLSEIPYTLCKLVYSKSKIHKVIKEMTFGSNSPFVISIDKMSQKIDTTNRIVDSDLNMFNRFITPMDIAKDVAEKLQKIDGLKIDFTARDVISLNTRKKVYDESASALCVDANDNLLSVLKMAARYEKNPIMVGEKSKILGFFSTKKYVEKIKLDGDGLVKEMTILECINEIEEVVDPSLPLLDCLYRLVESGKNELVVSKGGRELNDIVGSITLLDCLKMIDVFAYES